MLPIGHGGAIVKGPLTKVMALVQGVHEVPFKMGVNRS